MKRDIRYRCLSSSMRMYWRNSSGLRAPKRTVSTGRCRPHRERRRCAGSAKPEFGGVGYRNSPAAISRTGPELCIISNAVLICLAAAASIAEPVAVTHRRASLAGRKSQVLTGANEFYPARSARVRVFSTPLGWNSTS